MDNIKIRTGANIQSVLQSGINFPQAFTELAKKNSLQNGATKCEIEIIQEDDSSLIKIIDNGRGFDDVDSKSNMNDFEKYYIRKFTMDLNASGSGLNWVQWGWVVKSVMINYPK